MLELIIGDEGFDQDNNIFVLTNVVKLELEHSLAALSKWEQKYKLPFLSSDKSREQLEDYVRMMCLTPNIPPEVFQRLDESHYETINEYIADPMTATWFGKDPNERPAQKIITAEVIYYWMSALNIWIEAENWHLNRLITLVRVINAENSPKKPMSKADQARQQRELNARRRQEMQNRG